MKNNKSIGNRLIRMAIINYIINPYYSQGIDIFFSYLDY